MIYQLKFDSDIAMSVIHYKVHCTEFSGMFAGIFLSTFTENVEATHVKGKHTSAFNGCLLRNTSFIWRSKIQIVKNISRKSFTRMLFSQCTHAFTLFIGFIRLLLGAVQGAAGRGGTARYYNVLRPRYGRAISRFLENRFEPASTGARRRTEPVRLGPGPFRP